MYKSVQVVYKHAQVVYKCAQVVGEPAGQTCSLTWKVTCILWGFQGCSLACADLGAQVSFQLGHIHAV